MYWFFENDDYSIDLTPYIILDGLSEANNDIEGPNSGTSIIGTPIRDVIRTQNEFNIRCVPLPAPTLSTLRKIIQTETFSVTYDDSELGRVTRTMYSDGRSWNFYRRVNSVDWFRDVAFTLHEV